MIKCIRMGEIIRVENKDYVIVNTKGKNGSLEWDEPTLIKLETVIRNINRKPYYKRLGFPEPPIKRMIKSFKGLKLTNLKGGLKK